MYEDNERRINWLSILRRIIVILIILVVIFGIITLVTKCSKKEDNRGKTIEPTVNLKSQITDIQKATIDYLTVETLPTNLNQTKTVKLKYLINKNLIGNVKDSNGNICDTDASYSEITRLENNYAMKTTLVCGKNTDYSVVYIGCFDNCKNGICTGNASQNGICTVKPEDNKNNNDDSKNDKNNGENPSDEKTNNSKTPSKTSTTTKSKVLYEYKKPNYTYYCEKGELIGNDCKRLETWTYMGIVKETNVPTYSTYTTSAKVSTVSFTNPSYAVNTNNTTYEFVSYRNGKYNYNKYTCSAGTINGKTCTVATTINKVVKSCADESYTYNSKNNTCTKTAVVTIWDDPKTKVTYNYTWSEKTSLSGWTKTGRTK